MPDGRAITSEQLASLVVDGLVDAGFIAKGDLERAIHVAAIEIDVRKAAGDYSSYPSPPDYTGTHPDRAG